MIVFVVEEKHCIYAVGYDNARFLVHYFLHSFNVVIFSDFCPVRFIACLFLHDRVGWFLMVEGMVTIEI